MRISVFEVDGWEREVLAGLGERHDVRFEEGRLDASTVGAHGDAEVVSVFVYSDLGPEVLRRLPSLRLVATRSTGHDHVDGGWCSAHDVTVANVPSYGRNTVAEHVFALLLAVSRRVVESVERTRRGDFSQEGLQGFDLMGRTIGVVGTGEIGEHVVRIARGFGMDVVAHDVQPRAALAAELGFRYVDLDELLGSSDVVTLHVPAIEATHHLLGAAEFAALKHGAVLVNTARGSVVDTGALLDALQDGRVSAAALDVVEEEETVREDAELVHAAYRTDRDLTTLVADHVLLRAPNVVVTPHNAFNTREAVERILQTTCANIESFARGEPINVVVG